MTFLDLKNMEVNKQMDNNILIEQMVKARSLSCDKEIELFEDAVQKLCGNISINDIYNICNAFYDDTQNDEVMFEVIHLIEQLSGDEYLKCIAMHSPDMTDAHEWAMTLNKRIINSQKYFEKYIDVIDELENSYKKKILKLLSDIKNDNPKRFAEKIDLIHERIMRE